MIESIVAVFAVVATFLLFDYFHSRQFQTKEGQWKRQEQTLK